ncbi:hypothetical protein HMPREF1624_05101 [Sporothrix schenckii ATCC 58251]|uniref:Uncharacterized protein n=1 Tax=Sporothrix schenckii (strain ATCC 58251 / de Perez 2211183) TaxID=1391915 RepID=U7PRU2_SPOS1|nr:hypothetical protein HMPREF1624_05101 [Sporothrix schenckii ATCC 58251]
MRCELRKPTDYPVGLYLGPSRLTASYYNEDDQAVATLASVPASPAWRNYTEDVVRDRGRWGWDCEADMTCSNATATLFADGMAAILDASESALGHAPIIGYVVLPHNTSELTGLFDMVLHHDFPCYQWARHGDYIEYDMIRPAQAVQYAYHDQMPWGQSDDTGEEDAFVLLANLEPGFLELAGVCPKDVDVCRTSELAARAWPALGEDALWPPAMRSNTTSDDRASPSARFGQAVRRLADAVAAYVTAAATEPECNGHVRGVVVAGAASEQAMAALRIALHDVLPYANDTPFYDTVDPASVFSLGAAVLGRNTQLADERGDCACMVDEALRRPEGSPLDDAFPCNRTMAHLDSIY